MAYIFPSDEWILALKDKLNSDERYAHVARKWEGDILFEVKPDGPLENPEIYYLDLWHGQCREISFVDPDHIQDFKAAYTLSAPYTILARVLKGELDPMQAMITRKLTVKGSMAYMMRNVPVVLDFVRCAQEITTEILE
jgi:putative sterol carrier protein